MLKKKDWRIKAQKGLICRQLTFTK